MPNESLELSEIAEHPRETMRDLWSHKLEGVDFSSLVKKGKRSRVLSDEGRNSVIDYFDNEILNDSTGDIYGDTNLMFEHIDALKEIRSSATEGSDRRIFLTRMVQSCEFRARGVRKRYLDQELFDEDSPISQIFEKIGLDTLSSEPAFLSKGKEVLVQSVMSSRAIILNHLETAKNYSPVEAKIILFRYEKQLLDRLESGSLSIWALFDPEKLQEDIGLGEAVVKNLYGIGVDVQGITKLETTATLGLARECQIKLHHDADSLADELWGRSDSPKEPSKRRGVATRLWQKAARAVAAVGVLGGLGKMLLQRMEKPREENISPVATLSYEAPQQIDTRVPSFSDYFPEFVGLVPVNVHSETNEDSGSLVEDIAPTNSSAISSDITVNDESAIEIKDIQEKFSESAEEVKRAEMTDLTEWSLDIYEGEVVNGEFIFRTGFNVNKASPENYDKGAAPGGWSGNLWNTSEAIHRFGEITLEPGEMLDFRDVIDWMDNRYKVDSEDSLEHGTGYSSHGNGVCWAASTVAELLGTKILINGEWVFVFQLPQGSIQAHNHYIPRYHSQGIAIAPNDYGRFIFGINSVLPEGVTVTIDLSYEDDTPDNPNEGIYRPIAKLQVSGLPEEVTRFSTQRLSADWFGIGREVSGGMANWQSTKFDENDYPRIPESYKVLTSSEINRPDRYKVETPANFSVSLN